MSDLIYLIYFVSGCIAIAVSVACCVLWVLRGKVTRLIERYFPCKRLTENQINKIYKK